MTRLVWRAPAFLVCLPLSFSFFGSKWVVPGAEFLGIPTKTLSKVKHIARPACRPALKSTASQGINIRPLGHIVLLVAAQIDHLSFFFSIQPCLCFSFSAGVVGVLLPALSLFSLRRPAFPLDEANLEACACAHFCDACGNGRQQGCCVQPCLTAPLVRSLLALEQQFPTTPNNHGDMTTR